MRRVVVDTNIWISALVNPAGRPAEVITALLAGRFRLVTSAPLLDELTEVLQRPRIARKHGLSRTMSTRMSVCWGGAPMSLP